MCMSITMNERKIRKIVCICTVHTNLCVCARVCVRVSNLEFTCANTQASASTHTQAYKYANTHKQRETHTQRKRRGDRDRDRERQRDRHRHRHRHRHTHTHTHTTTIRSTSRISFCKTWAHARSFLFIRSKYTGSSLKQVMVSGFNLFEVSTSNASSSQIPSKPRSRSLGIGFKNSQESAL